MKFIEYIKGVRSEARKIVFPSSDEVKKNTAVVLGVCGAAALMLWGVSELVIKLITVTLG